MSWNSIWFNLMKIDTLLLVVIAVLVICVTVLMLVVLIQRVAIKRLKKAMLEQASATAKYREKFEGYMHLYNLSKNGLHVKNGKPLDNMYLM